MTFVQIIEMTTTKAPEIEELIDGWMAATEGRRSASRSLLTKDRERPDTYVQVVEFPSYEEAMANSALPETTAFAEKLSALCCQGPRSAISISFASTSCSQPNPAGSCAFSGRPGPRIRTRGVPNNPFGHSTSSQITDQAVPCARPNPSADHPP